MVGEIGFWNLEVINSKHNHCASAAGAHSVLRRMALKKPEIRSEMTRQLAIQTAPSKVLAAIRVDDPTAANAMFAFRDVYNFQAKLRRQELGPLSPIQALIREFDRDDWVYALQKDERNQITNLFFFRSTCSELLKRGSSRSLFDLSANHCFLCSF